MLSQQAVVDAAKNTYQSLLSQLEDARVKQGQAAHAFSVVEPAQAPSAPTSPRWKFNLAAGLLAGIAAGVALSLVLEYVDPTLRGVRDLEGVTGLPVLASIPFGIRWKYPPPPVSQDYRLLATKLQTGLQENKFRSVLFTSARPEEGNTTVATYTAMALAQAGLRVLLVDANLNRPDLHKLFNIPIAPGLFNFLSTNGVRPAKPMAEAATDAIQAVAGAAAERADGGHQDERSVGAARLGRDAQVPRLPRDGVGRGGRRRRGHVGVGRLRRHRLGRRWSRARRRRRAGEQPTAWKTACLS